MECKCTAALDQSLLLSLSRNPTQLEMRKVGCVVMCCGPGVVVVVWSRVMSCPVHTDKSRWWFSSAGGGGTGVLTGLHISAV